MIDIISSSAYTIITPHDENRPIVVRVDADATSTSVMWEYVCDYHENGCQVNAIEGIDGAIIPLDPIDKHSSGRTSGTIEWNGETIYYVVDQVPNPTYEPITEYAVSSITIDDFTYGVQSGESGYYASGDSVPCGTYEEKELFYTYSAITYENDSPSSPSTTEIKSGKTSILLDCSDHIGGGDASSVIDILGTDITYYYHCNECEGASCTPFVKIMNVQPSNYKINGISADYVPCSGVENGELTCDLTYKVKIRHNDCSEETFTSSTRNVGCTSIPPCVGERCCQTHNVQTQAIINVDGQQFTVPFTVMMRGDINGTCYTGCGQICESAITTTLNGWTLTYKGVSYDAQSITTMPIIPLGERTKFHFDYSVFWEMLNPICETSSGTAIGSEDTYIESADCMYHIYKVITPFADSGDVTSCCEYDGCHGISGISVTATTMPDVYPIDPHDPDYQVDHILAEWVFPINITIDGEVYENQVTITFPYDREKCRDIPSS
jgi:hypothetical protein